MELLEMIGQGVHPVAVLEDDESVRGRILESLGTLPGLFCKGAKSLKEFRGVVENQKPDAVSVDIGLGHRMSGFRAFKIAREEDEDRAVVVFTRYPDQVEKARRKGADAVLVKRGLEASLVELRRLVGLAVGTTHARKIRRCLLEFKAGDLPEFPIGSLGEQWELEKVAKRARSLALESPSYGEEVTRLRGVLRGAGLWKVFNVKDFVSHSLPGKLQVLCSYVGMRSEEMAFILRIEEESASLLLEGRSPEGAMGRSVERLHKLLSVLAFVLRLSRSEPELMPRYWTVRDLYRGCERPPPWENLGLQGFLRKEGPDGLSAAVDWIRRGSR